MDYRGLCLTIDYPRISISATVYQRSSGLLLNIKYLVTANVREKLLRYSGDRNHATHTEYNYGWIIEGKQFANRQYFCPTFFI